MLAKVVSGATAGLDGVLIDVEVDVANRGFPTFTIVGLPSKAVDEAKDRVRTAIVNAEFEMPDSRITVNLAPADLPKEGSSFDLPIALGILAASGAVNKDALKKSLFVGELSLEGKIRHVPGVISIAISAQEKGVEKLFVPQENVQEAAIIEDLEVYPVKSLIEIILHLNDHKKLEPHQTVSLDEYGDGASYEIDFSDVRGQEVAKRACEIASAGFHNLHLKGPPGAGKTMLSRALPTILPPMNKIEVLEVTKIYSVAGLLTKTNLMLTRPFRAPHHTTSRIGIIGGGSHPIPGEISLAHRGVLFLDEFPEFPRSVLEALRQPLEDGHVTISRAAGSTTYPSRFLLLAASNPCPCGYLGHPKKRCKCMPGAIMRYKKRLSGPILDRIDLHVDVSPVEEEKLIEKAAGEASQKVRARVLAAQERQKKRFKDTKVHANGEMGTKDVRALCTLTDEASDLLKMAVARLSLSARSYFKIIKVAQTIADLAKADKIESAHVAEALQYRVKEE